MSDERLSGGSGHTVPANPAPAAKDVGRNAPIGVKVVLEIGAVTPAEEKRDFEMAMSSLVRPSREMEMEMEIEMVGRFVDLVRTLW